MSAYLYVSFFFLLCPNACVCVSKRARQSFQPSPFETGIFLTSGYYIFGRRWNNLIPVIDLYSKKCQVLAKIFLNYQWPDAQGSGLAQQFNFQDSRGNTCKMQVSLTQALHGQMLQHGCSAGDGDTFIQGHSWYLFLRPFVAGFQYTSAKMFY